MADHLIFEATGFMLQRGAVLAKVQPAYKTLGELLTGGRRRHKP